MRTFAAATLALLVAIGGAAPAHATELEVVPVPGTGSLNPLSPVVLDGTLYFSGGAGYQLMQWDGVNAPEAVTGTPLGVKQIVVIDDELYFVAKHPVDPDPVVWNYDPDTMPLPLNLAGSPENPGKLAAWGTTLVFQAYDGVNYYGHTYDGATFTQIPGTQTNPEEFTPYAGDLFFSAYNNDDSKYSLYRWDGTVAVPAVPVGSPDDPNSLTVMGPNLFFAADSGVLPGDPDVLWATDGATFEETSPPQDVFGLAVIDGPTLVLTGDQGGASAIYTSDGMSPPVLVPGSPSNAYGATQLGDLVYLSASNGGDNVAWIWDGDATFTPLPGSPSFPESFLEFSGTVYFSGYVDGTYALYAIVNPDAPVLAATGTDEGGKLLTIAALVLFAGIALVTAGRRRREAEAPTLR
jgi:LPXTG-motif cell wall-anchored protein